MEANIREKYFVCSYKSDSYCIPQTKLFFFLQNIAEHMISLIKVYLMVIKYKLILLEKCV